MRRNAGHPWFRAASATLLLALSCALRASPAVAQSCPPSVLGLYTTEPVESFAAIDSAVQAGSGRMVSYDLVHGALRLNHPGNVGWAFVRAVDRFMISGLPQGTVVPITALLDVDGFSATLGCGGTGCHLTFGARLGDSAGDVERSVETTFHPDTLRLVETMSRLLSIEVGVPYELHYELWVARPPGASHWGGGSARLRFSGLPAQATLTSCQGYAVEASTPVRTTSWGRVKQIYR